MATSTQTLSAGVLALLEADLPALVAAANLPAIKSFVRHSPARINPALAPQVWIEVSRKRPGALAGFGGANQHQTRTRTVLVGVTAAGEGDPDVAEERLEGYADLIEALIDANPTVGGSRTARFLGTDYSPNLSDRPNALFREAVLTFEFERWGTLGADD